MDVSAANLSGSIVFESSRIAQHLMENGVPMDAIICDFMSWDTVGNAYFTRLVIEALLRVASPRRYKKLHIHEDGRAVGRLLTVRLIQMLCLSRSLGNSEICFAIAFRGT